MAYTDKTWAVGEAATSTLFNTYIRDALRSLAEPARAINNITTASNDTTASASFVDIDTTDYQVSVTPAIGAGQTCDILVGGMLSIKPAAGATVRIGQLDLVVNGVSVSGGTGICTFAGNTSQTYPVTFLYLLQGQDNTAKTIKLRYRIGAGDTVTLYNNDGSNSGVKPQFWARVL